MGEEEYNWALRNNLRLSDTADQLYEASWPIVEKTRADMVALAKQIAAAHEVEGRCRWARCRGDRVRQAEWRGAQDRRADAPELCGRWASARRLRAAHGALQRSR